LVLVLVFCAVAALGADFASRIELSSSTFNAGETLVLRWEIHNKGDEIEHMLAWNTPFEGEWNSPMFSIVHENGERAEYQGRIMKRATPTLENFASVHPGTFKSGELVLSEGFKFYTAGKYFVTLHSAVIPIDGDSEMLSSNLVSFEVLTPHERTTTFIPPNASVNYNGCSSTEQSTVKTAISNAVTASQNALNYLVKNSCTSTYVEWFGTVSTTNWNKITKDFTNIHSLLASNNFGIDCTCNQPGVYAYVYPTDPRHTIHLCPVFWTATTNKYQFNSQPGTLSHESSHFNDVAGTQDYQYGVTGCRLS